jgi:diphthamide biosynthesis protein 2
MTSAFSSNDESVICRIVEEEANEPTPVELLPIKYELDRCVAWIKELQLQRVCLQFPNKLLVDSVSVSKYLKSKTHKEIYILGDTNYGRLEQYNFNANSYVQLGCLIGLSSYFSCCVDLIAAAHVPSDGLIHFDDACLSNLESPKIPLLFIFLKTEINNEALKICLQEELKQHQYSLIVCDCKCSHFLGKFIITWAEKF